MSAAHGHFQQNSSPVAGIWYFLNRLLCVLIVVTVGAIAAYHFVPEVSKRRDQQVRLEQLKLAVEKERQLLIRNTRAEELLKHDPEFVAIFARDRLDLMKEGEMIYRFDPQKPDRSNMRLNP